MGITENVNGDIFAGGIAMEIHFHVPEVGELWYMQKLLSDPDTMSYNKGLDMDFEWYDRETGCIDFPEECWEGWHRYWTKNAPERFYAYIVRGNEFIGDVNLRKFPEDWYEDRYSMGIVIESIHRGNGYAAQAVGMLLDVAFCEIGAASVHNEFECYRQAAVRVHTVNGFSVDSDDGHIMRVSITAEKYNKMRDLQAAREKKAKKGVGRAK